MAIKDDIQQIIEEVNVLQARVDTLEANQRNAESGTTASSAGRMPELSTENRVFKPAGNPAMPEVIKSKVQSMLGFVEKVGSPDNPYLARQERSIFECASPVQ